MIAEYTNSTTYFVHHDHLGSTRLVTGLNQAVAQNLDYFPYGELNSTNSGITTHEFTGDERDAESGLDHTQFRQYSSSMARWMTPDPAGLAAANPGYPQSWNRYAYVLNNPLSLVDPFGLSCITTTFIDDNGDEQTFISDDGDGQGCAAAGVGAGGDSSNFNDITPDQVPVNADGGSSLSSLFWDTINAFWNQVPWSASVVDPLVDLGPNASGGVGLTIAYSPKSDKTCLGIVGGGQFPATGRSIAAGPLLLGNLNKADSVLSGASGNFGVQYTPTIGVQAIANSSGWLGGPTFGEPGIFTGVSVCGCSQTLTQILRLAIENFSLL
jgi:RHS repeat-associated protein